MARGGASHVGLENRLTIIGMMRLCCNLRSQAPTKIFVAKRLQNSPGPRQIIVGNFILFHHLRVKLILPGKPRQSVGDSGAAVFHLYRETLLATKRCV